MHTVMQLEVWLARGDPGPPGPVFHRRTSAVASILESSPLGLGYLKGVDAMGQYAAMVKALEVSDTS